jgi:hypothetical protein
MTWLFCSFVRAFQNFGNVLPDQIVVDCENWDQACDSAILNNQVPNSSAHVYLSLRLMSAKAGRRLASSRSQNRRPDPNGAYRPSTRKVTQSLIENRKIAAYANPFLFGG